MLKWCDLTRNRVIARENAQRQASQISKSQDVAFSEKVHTVILQYFQKEKSQNLDKWQFPSVVDYLEQENQQLKTYVKNIKSILKKHQKAKFETTSSYRLEREKCIRNLLENLNMKNNSLRKKITIDKQEIQLLTNLIEEVTEENREKIDSIDVLDQIFTVVSPMEVLSESINTNQKDLTRGISEESGYSTDSSEDTIKEASSYSSIDTLLAEESTPLIVLKKKNTLYKKWLSSLHQKLSSDPTLQFVEPWNALESLQILSIENVKIKQEIKRGKETTEYLQGQFEEIKWENARLNALYEKGLREKITRFEIDRLERSVKDAREELEDIAYHLNRLKEKKIELHRMEVFLDF